ncbi:hypothetical protein [Tengunoibacter tsumagoiensis]|uniref:Uncharacterized protein n=1 Tax=Tengunoibacter tsumagoiensis TaxID=2014871 RepID=A0A402A7E3_9CHLR|nr:hypothetical protein [Tengunoibacter tsumagoiensis]GCE15077.1 hypothetical protein KTT_49360 [Tengunoibacter tsumagoiensis]
MDTFSQAHNHPVREKRKQDYLDDDCSLRAAAAIRAHPNTCFTNILDLFLTPFSRVFSLYGKLIEGWYVIELDDEIVLNEHGWIEMSDGKIIDPTVVLLLPLEQPVYYFSGVERSWNEVKSIMRKEDAWLPYVRFSGTYGSDGMGHQMYKAAHDAAVQKVFSLATMTQPPKKMTFLTAQDPLDVQREMGVSMQVFLLSPDHEEEQHEKA